MPERLLKYSVPIWLCGQREVLYVYEEVDPTAPGRNAALLDEYHPLADGHRPALGEWLASGHFEKRQIILHWTGSNNTARRTLATWSGKKYRCGRTLRSTGRRCREKFLRASDRCHLDHVEPAPPASASLPTTQAAAQYVLERTPASYGDRAVAPTGGHRQGDGLPDVIEAAPSYTNVIHANNSRQSIGIELINFGNDPRAMRSLRVAGNGVMEAAARPGTVDRASKFQALQDEQYHTLALLLRYLCMKHRIRRQFLGATLAEKFALHGNHGRDLGDFRGLHGHLSSTNEKVCGGTSYSRSRIRRLITDEWWMPVQLDGAERPYYTFTHAGAGDAPCYVRFAAPVAAPAADDGNADDGNADDGNADDGNADGAEPSAAAPIAELFSQIRSAETLEALHDTASYFDPAQLSSYYAATEAEAGEGTFPVGRLEVWHGGVHLPARATNDKVYAAASGRVVAARLAPDPPAGPRPGGSVRFALVRHFVHLRTASGRVVYRTTDGEPGAETEWVEPTCVHTLYMHLAPAANPAAVDAGNPPWLNAYLRAGGAAPGDAVFCPDVPVLVGDWLGATTSVGVQERALHFEVLSKDRIDAGPFADAAVTFERDPDADLLCEDPALGRFFDAAGIETTVTDRATGRSRRVVTLAAVLAGLREETPTLRHAKVWRTSDWALESAEALRQVLERRNRFAASTPAFEEALQREWERWLPYMWVRELRALNAGVADQLFDDSGRCWHYHPITFLAHVNELARGEDGPERVGDVVEEPVATGPVEADEPIEDDGEES